MVCWRSSPLRIGHVLSLVLIFCLSGCSVVSSMTAANACLRRSASFLSNGGASPSRLNSASRPARFSAHRSGPAATSPEGAPSTLVVCNWKCYPTASTAPDHIRRFANLRVPSNVQLLTAPCPVFLREMVAEYKSAGSSCVVCSQDVSAASSAAGPFTGEVTAGLLKDMGIEWTIIGHSERRGGGPLGIDERRELINRKLKAALAAGLKVIVCIGESGGRDTNYVIQQLEDICTGITDSDDRLVIAYEPGGCVGTDRPAAPEEVNETITSIKSMAKCNITRSRFIYGGSVDRSNASLYTRQPNVDGIMVGRLWQHPEFEPLLETI